jgi:hypothetical protein
MACRGVHFAITGPEVEQLRSLDEEQRLELITEQLEEAYFHNSRHYVGESDKAWDAMHRALADGQLTWDGGTYPLNHAVLAGELLYSEDDYIMSLKSPEQVRDISQALAAITEDELRRRYFAIDADSYGDALTDDDFAYTWDSFETVRALYARAAQDGRYVLFTVDQ